MGLNLQALGVADLVLVTPRVFADERGSFVETWSRRELSKAGINVDFVQDNQSWSRNVGTLRGLHFQAPPHAQDKLIRCTRGKIFDVAVDIRRGSPAYGQWYGVELSPETGSQLFIPRGFLHAFMTLEPDTEVQYKCSDYYAPECDGAVRWDSLGIDWPLKGAPVLSEKDSGALPFSAFQSPFVWNEGT